MRAASDSLFHHFCQVLFHCRVLFQFLFGLSSGVVLGVFCEIVFVREEPGFCFVL